MSHSFWSSGAGAHYEGLKEQHNAELAALRDQLAACECDAERAEIREQMKCGEVRVQNVKVQGVPQTPVLIHGHDERASDCTLDGLA